MRRRITNQNRHAYEKGSDSGTLQRILQTKGCIASTASRIRGTIRSTSGGELKVSNVV